MAGCPRLALPPGLHPAPASVYCRWLPYLWGRGPGGQGCRGVQRARGSYIFGWGPDRQEPRASSKPERNAPAHTPGTRPSWVSPYALSPPTAWAYGSGRNATGGANAGIQITGRDAGPGGKDSGRVQWGALASGGAVHPIPNPAALGTPALPQPPQPPQLPQPLTPPEGRSGPATVPAPSALPCTCPHMSLLVLNYDAS